MRKFYISIIIIFALFFGIKNNVSAQTSTISFDKSWNYGPTGNARYSYGTTLANWGRIKLLFNVKTNGPSAITQVTFTGSNQICYPNSSTQYYNDSSVTVQLQFFNCDLEIGSNGLGDMVIDYSIYSSSSSPSSQPWFATSYYMFAMSNSSTAPDYTNILNSINGNLDSIEFALYDIDTIMRNWHLDGTALLNNQQAMITALQAISSNGTLIHNDFSQSNQNTNDIKNNTKETNDLLKDDNVSQSESMVDDLKDNSAFQDNTGLNAIIGMPLTFINNLGNSCQPIELTIPYMDYTFQLPCIQQLVYNYMPGLVVVIKVLVNGLLIYWVMLDIFKIIKNAKNPEDDRIEVLDL